MGNAQWLLELALLLLLAATLFHAMRLERALGVLKRDRATLEELVEGFNQSTRQAESAIERLRTASDGMGRQIARQTETAQRLRDDLVFLTERGDRLAERLESAVRSARMAGDGFAMSAGSPPASGLEPGATSPLDAELPGARTSFVRPAATQPVLVPSLPDPPQPVLRSQAERELLRALRAGR